MIEKQPVKALYLAFAGLLTLTKLPFWVLKYSIAAGRQNRKWTFQQALTNSLSRLFLYYSTAVRVRTGANPAARQLGDRLVQIPPADAARYCGVLTAKPAIRPTAVPSVWYPSLAAAAPAPDKRVVMHVHGGAFVIRPSDVPFAAKTLGSALAAPVLMVEYRLASNPDGAFPAGIQDALSVYLYLLASGYSATNVIVSGDSAGANIILGLLRYLYSDEGKSAAGVAPPGAALLWCAWVDVASARANPSSAETHRNASTDYLAKEFVEWGATAIGSDSDVSSPYLTSLGHPFACPETKLWYQAGSLEILVDDITQSAEEMKNVPGNRVALCIEENSNHDTLMLGASSGFGPHAIQSAKNASEFLQQT